MHQTITTLIVLAICINCLFCQHPFDEELMLLEQKIFLCKNDSEQADLRLQKLDLYFVQNYFSEDALKEAKQINYLLLRHKSDLKRFLWNSSVLAYMNNDKRMSLRRYNLYREIYLDSSIHSLLLGYLAASDFDPSLSEALLNSISIQDSGAACISCLEKLQGYNRKHKGLYLMASAVVPGLGTIINGNVRKGFTSLAVNAGAWMAAYELIKNNLYINATLLGAAMIIKLYYGNIRLTKKVFENKEQYKKSVLVKECERNIGKILEKYPIRIYTMP